MSDHNNDVEVETLTVGPTDFLVMEFPGNKFNGDILGDLRELVEAGTIRIIDLVVVSKSIHDSVSIMELQELGAEASDVLAGLQATINQLITRDDINSIAAKLANNSTAALLLYENSWAVKTMKALVEADGRVLAYQRIPHELMIEAINDVAALRLASVQG